MATTTIPWGDGSGDNIYLDYPAASGDQTVAVSSDANTGASRTKLVTFSASGVSPVTLTVKQAAGALPGNYVRDGLVLFLDGIDKGETAGAWTDLVGGVVFTASGAESAANGWITGQGKFLINSDNLSWPFSDCTIEAAITRQGAMVTQIDVISTLGNGNIALSFASNRVYTGHTNAGGEAIVCGAPAQSASLPYCISGMKGKAVVNGTEYATSRSGGVGSANYNAIGARGNGNYYLTGIIHSVRIYSRQLTTAEIRQNQGEDNARFNLGITIAGT